MLGVVGHRRPVVRAEGPGRDVYRTAVEVADIRHLDRAAGLEIHVARPVHFRDRLRRDQFPVAAVDHVEEAVLRGVHERLDLAALDAEVRQDDVHVRVVVPGLARGRLVVPAVLAGVGVEGEHRAEEQVVPATRAPDLLVPGRAVAGADVDGIELWIIGKSVPRVAAPAHVPPLTGPGLRRHLHRRVLEAVRRVARDDPEAPRLLARLGIVGRDVATGRADLGAPVADQHLAPERLRRAGDVHRLRGIDRGGGPHVFPGPGVEADQPPVNGGEVDLVAPHRHAPAAVHEGDAHAVRGVFRHLRVVGPQEFPGDRVHGARDVARADEVHDPVGHQGRRDESHRVRHVQVPVELELRDVLAVDLHRAGRNAARCGCGRR